MNDDTELDAALAALRAGRSEVPPGLMARVLQDAGREQRRPSPLASLFAAFGGWQGATALAASALIGVTVGMSSADTVARLTGDVAWTIGDEDPFDAYLPEG